MKLTVLASIEIQAPPERVFDLATSNEGLASALQPFGPIPGVVSGEMIGGAPLASGSRRMIRMTDKSEIEEEILAYERPLRHRYRWLHAPAGPFGLLIRRGEADWVFSPSSRGTRIEWTYTFDLTSPLAAPFAMPLLALFRRWMQRGLERVAINAGHA